MSLCKLPHRHDAVHPWHKVVVVLRQLHLNKSGCLQASCLTAMMLCALCIWKQCMPFCKLSYRQNDMHPLHAEGCNKRLYLGNACMCLCGLPHRHDAVRPLHALDIVVGHPHSLGQALLMALHQALHKCIIGPRVEDGETRPMDLVQIHTGLLKTLQTRLHMHKAIRQPL